jgi:hypothetical protein
MSAVNSPNSGRTGDFDPCLKEQHLFQRDLSCYEKFVTDFYTRYPQDEDVPVRVLLLQADQKTIQEVHEWLAKKN